MYEVLVERSLRLTRRQFLVISAGASASLLAACSAEESESSMGQSSTPVLTIEPSPVPSPVATPEPEPTPTAHAVPSPSPAPTGAAAGPSPAPMPDPSPSPPLDPATLRATWRRIEPSGPWPAARRDHSFVADSSGRKTYLFGGHAAGLDLADLWVFDVDTEHWEEIVPDGDRPPARFGHSAGFDGQNERLVVFGGQTGPNFFNDVWSFDIERREWQRVDTGDPAPSPRYGSGDAYDPVANRLYVTHGFTFQGRFDDTWSLDLNEDDWDEVSGPVDGRPIPRCLVRGASDPDRNRVLLFGGQADVAAYLGDFWALSLDDRAWTELPGGPEPRHLYSLAQRRDPALLLIFGGRIAAGHARDFWLFDMKQDRWHQIPFGEPGPDGRDGHDAAWLAERESMLLFGGRTSSELDDLWLANLDS